MTPPPPTADLSRESDDHLMTLVAAGDPGAFEVVYDHHSSRAYSLAYRLLGDRDAAEDLVQDALLIVWRNADAFDPGRGSLGTWILAIVHRRGIDRLRTVGAMRRRQRELQAVETTREDEPDTATLGVAHMLSDTVRIELAALPEEQSRVLRLAYYGGFTHHEIAELLDLPLGTIKGRIRLGLERLRRGLDMTGGVG